MIVPFSGLPPINRLTSKFCQTIFFSLLSPTIMSQIYCHFSSRSVVSKKIPQFWEQLSHGLEDNKIIYYEPNELQGTKMSVKPKWMWLMVRKKVKPKKWTSPDRCYLMVSITPFPCVCKGVQRRLGGGGVWIEGVLSVWLLVKPSHLPNQGKNHTPGRSTL